MLLRILTIYSVSVIVVRANIITECLSLSNSNNEKFELLYDWNFINFTWPTKEIYNKAISTGYYIPENNGVVGVKYYDDNLYLALPIAKPGAPVTLARVPHTPDKHTVTNPLLTPYPSWSMNVGSNCDNLQNVQSMEIDRKGIMWVLDGRRVDPTNKKCPPKIVLLDINAGGRVIQTYVVPNNICSHSACFLNDIVVDEIDGGYAYITDTSSDPGLIVFSRKHNRAWKVRDETMHGQNEAVNFTVHGNVNTKKINIDGITMAPQACLDDPDRLVYYTALTGFNLYSISSKVLRNERLATSKRVHDYIKDEGRKTGPSDGLMMDSEGKLYYGILTEDAVKRWNSKTSITTSELVDKNEELIIWPDSFGFDTFGTLHLLANRIDNFLSHPISMDEINFRLLKLYTGTCSYQF